VRKKLSKCYPTFDTPKVVGGRSSDHWCSLDELPRIPRRFGKIFFHTSVDRSEENYISFTSDIDFPSDMRETNQDAWFMYDEPLILNSSDQIRGNLPDGDVDFFLSTQITIENGGSLIEPNTNRGVRYPYKVATYFPIRNVLVLKSFVSGEPTPSLKQLLRWILQKVENVGYKFNKHGVLLIGCDPEFNITDIMDERINADRIFPDPRRRNPIGTDGNAATGELRPAPANCPLKLTDNIRKLMADAAKKLGNDKKLLTGGGGNIAPTGHHIHFSKMISSEELELLDAFVGIPALKIKGAKRAGGGYENTGREALRRQPHGCEYRTPASSLIPELTNALHVTAYCCVMKWETLTEGESFDFEIDDSTGTPTLQAYRDLDITQDKRYTPHLEEFWKWVNHKDGREIDPKRDCLHFWVEGRKEVKPYPGIKVNWASNIFPSVAKEKFIEVSQLEKIYDLTVFTLPASEQDEEKVLQICMPADKKKKIDLDELRKLKTKYDIANILGFDHSSLKLGFSQALLNDFRTMKKLKTMVIAFAKIICT